MGGSEVLFLTRFSEIAMPAEFTPGGNIVLHGGCNEWSSTRSFESDTKTLIEGFENSDHDHQLSHWLRGKVRVWTPQPG